MTRQQVAIAHAVNLLDAYSPLKIMGRGYAIVEHDGKVVKTTHDVSVNQKIAIRLANGQLNATVDAIKEE